MDRYAITNARIFASSTGEVIDPATVIVDGERISDVVTGDSGTITDAVAIDASGCTVLPGLIDSHVHLKGLHPETAGVRELDPSRVAGDTLALARELPRLAGEGLTTVRDCGYPHTGIFAVRRHSLERRPDGLAAPRLVLSGQGLCATGGHGAASAVEVDGTDAMRQAVRRLTKSGADWIKLMMTGGTATPGELVSDVQLTVAEAEAAVDEAHRRSKRVAAHCSNLAGTIAALDAGVDSIEHGIDLDVNTAKRMADLGTWLSAAMRCTEIEGTAGPESGIPEFVRIKGAEIYRRQMESFQRAIDAGVRFVVSTDAQQSYLRLGIGALVEEMAVMVRLGLSTSAVLRAATFSPAEMLDLSDEIGEIAPGRIADLVVVAGDPLADLRRLLSPTLVMLRGRMLPGLAGAPGGADRGA